MRSFRTILIAIVLLIAAPVMAPPEGPPTPKKFPISMDVGAAGLDGKLSSHFVQVTGTVTYSDPENPSLARLGFDSTAELAPRLGASMIGIGEHGIPLEPEVAKLFHGWLSTRPKVPYAVALPPSRDLATQYDERQWENLQEGLGHAPARFRSIVVVFDTRNNFEPVFYSRWAATARMGCSHDVLLPLEEAAKLTKYPLLDTQSGFHFRNGISFVEGTTNAVVFLASDVTEPGKESHAAYVVLTREIDHVIHDEGTTLHPLLVPRDLIRVRPGVTGREVPDDIYTSWVRAPLVPTARTAARGMWTQGGNLHLTVPKGVLENREEVVEFLRTEMAMLLQQRRENPSAGRRTFSWFWPYLCHHVIAAE